MNETALVIDSERYAQLLREALPAVIQTEEENERYIEQLEALSRRCDQLSAEEQKLAELLTLLIEDFEERHYQLRPASPAEVLTELMEIHGLKQKDLVDIFGTPSIVSEVLNGRRELSKAHIKGLSERFNLPVDLFFGPSR